MRVMLLFFFFQAEDGIRDDLVTGVQTCALPIWGVVARILSPFAKRIGLADPPGGRKQHSGTIPVTGGIAMFAGFFLAAMVSGLIGGATVALVVALFLLVFGGAADDMHDISPQAKLLFQLVATLLMTSWAGVQ